MVLRRTVGVRVVRWAFAVWTGSPASTSTASPQPPGDDPDVLRLENLDTDVQPPSEAVEATRAAVGEDDANSWLPFTGRDDLKEAVAAFVARRGGAAYDGPREIVITCGEGDAMLDALFCLTDPGDEVDPHRPDLRREC